MEHKRRNQGDNGNSIADRRHRDRTRTAFILQSTYFVMAAVVPGLMIIFYALSVPSGDRLRVIAMAVLYGSAAVTLGGLIGFLFGIPRSQITIERSESGLRAISGDPTVTPNRSLPNTNLEQISDWLTKVIVGVTLAQVGKIAPGAADLFKSMSDALGVGGSGAGFVGALATYSAAIGFMMGWLATRMWVALAIATVDASVSDSGEPEMHNGPQT